MLMTLFVYKTNLMGTKEAELNEQGLVSGEISIQFPVASRL